MSIFKRVVAMVMLGVSLLLSTASTPATAAAFVPFGVSGMNVPILAGVNYTTPCYVGELCIYQLSDYQYQDYLRGYRKFTRSGMYYLEGTFMNNRMTSAMNRTHMDALFIDNRFCTPPAAGGYGWWLNGGTEVRAYTGRQNDSASCIVLR